MSNRAKQISKIAKLISGFKDLATGNPLGLIDLAFETLSEQHKQQVADLYFDAVKAVYESEIEQQKLSGSTLLPPVLAWDKVKEHIRYKAVSVVALDDLAEVTQQWLLDNEVDKDKAEIIIPKVKNNFVRELVKESELYNLMMFDAWEAQKSFTSQNKVEVDRRLSSVESDVAKLFESQIQEAITELQLNQEGMTKEVRQLVETNIRDIFISSGLVAKIESVLATETAKPVPSLNISVGDNNNAPIVVGDGNTINFEFKLDNGESLQLPFDAQEILKLAAKRPLLKRIPKKNFKSGFTAPSRLLNSEYEIVPFYGRDAEIADLTAWCDDDKRFDLRFYRGAGGEGKTRLARELVVLQSSKGWYSGFLNVENVSAANADWASLFANTQPVLIIVDYAESKRDELKRLFKELYEGIEGSELQIRIVLLARTDFLWWQEVSIASGLDNLPEKATELLPIDESLEQSFRRACVTFAKLLSKEDTTNYITNEQLKLSEGNVLFLHMLALLSVNGRELGGNSSLKILDGILELEKEYWTKVPIFGLNEPNFNRQFSAISQLMTVATLGYDLSDFEKSRFLIRQLPELRQEKDAVQNAVIERCEHLYGESKGEIKPIRPDILGEHLIERTLFHRNDDLDLRESILSFVFDSDNVNVAESIQTLVRLAQRRGNPGVQLLKESIEPRKDRLAFLASVMMPGPTVLLNKYALELAEYALQLQSFEKKMDVRSAAERARMLMNLGQRYRENGRFDEALRVTKQARSIFQQLYEIHKPTLPFLIRSLASIGSIYNELGQYQQALEYVEIANRLTKDLSGIGALKAKGSLFTTKRNLLRSLGENQQSLDAAKKAKDIYEKLSLESTSESLSSLAGSLINLGANYSDTGDFKAALNYTLESKNIFKDLANENPDEFLPDYAIALTNLGSRYIEIEDYDKALSVLNEDVEICRLLVKVNSSAFILHLVKALGNLGVVLEKLNMDEEAINALMEVTKIYEDLYRKYPEGYAKDFAISLNNLSVLYTNFELFNESVEMGEQAQDIYEKVLVQHSNAVIDELSILQYNLAQRYLKIDETSKAFELSLKSIKTLLPRLTEFPKKYDQRIKEMLKLYDQLRIEMNQPIDKTVRFLYEK